MGGVVPLYKWGRTEQARHNLPVTAWPSTEGQTSCRKTTGWVYAGMKKHSPAKPLSTGYVTDQRELYQGERWRSIWKTPSQKEAWPNVPLSVIGTSVSRWKQRWDAGGGVARRHLAHYETCTFWHTQSTVPKPGTVLSQSTSLPLVDLESLTLSSLALGSFSFSSFHAKGNHWYSTHPGTDFFLNVLHLKPGTHPHANRARNQIYLTWSSFPCVPIVILYATIQPL